MLKKKIKLHWSFEQIANRNEEEIYIFSTSTIDRMIHIVPWDIQSLSVENGQYDRRIVPNLDGVKSVYLWNPYDYRKLLDAYEESKKNMNFADFGFDFGNDHTNLCRK